MEIWQELKLQMRISADLWIKQIRNSVYSKFKELGFVYVSLDLMGYRTGSMNEELEN